MDLQVHGRFGMVEQRVTSLERDNAKIRTLEMRLATLEEVVADCVSALASLTRQQGWMQDCLQLLNTKGVQHGA